MNLRLVALAVALAALLALGAGCGDEVTDEERRDALVDRLTDDLRAETDGALDEEAARCVAEGLADTVGVDGFDAVVAAARSDDDPELRDQVIDVFGACDALEPLLDRPS
ncbi:MAG TPA: hypothetical protein VFU14_12360 [Acidimicrobiales bacterium]|nr:hypothetical protein [Acidimicrobiales bacterium]